MMVVQMAATYALGTTVTLAAAPASNNMFSGWDGACSVAAPTCTLTVNTNLPVQANISK